MGSSLRPLVIERFGGVDLRRDAAEVGTAGAIDAANATLDRDGRVRARSGFASYTSGTTTDVRHGYVFSNPANHSRFLCQYGQSSAGKVAIFDRSSLGSPVASQAFTTVSASITGYQAIGTPASSLVFISTSSREIFKWDGAAFAAVAQAGRLIGLSPQDNRLVACDTGSSETSHVRFSDPGAPTTFNANNYVQLTPGDGEQFVAVATWREFIFVFKETRFFVFPGNDTDSQGNPVFNYRAVDGFGAIGTTGNQAVTVGKDGVYFAARDGVYRTNGGQPVRVSEPIGPWFDLTTGPYFTGKASTQSQTVYLSAVGDRVYFSRPPSSGHLIWALDTLTGNWEYWEPALGSNAVNGLGWLRDANDIPVLSVSSLDAIRTLSPAATQDASAFTAAYRTGFLDFGDPNPKDVKGILLDGTGTVTVSCATNSATALPAGTAVTLGTSPAISRGRYPKTHAGHNLSMNLALAAGSSVSRAVMLLESTRQPGEEQ